MDVDYSNESSSDNSEINGSSSSEEVNVGVDVNCIQPYAFEPIETDSGGEDSGSEEMVSESSSNSGNTRLQDTNW
jgi:hypothetical protein